MRRFGIVVTFDERYEFVKLYDILRDMDFEFNSIREEGEEDSVDVTEKKVSTTHRRKDMDLL